MVDAQGNELGAESVSTDPAGNKVLGASEALARKLVQMMGDKLFQGYRRANSAREAIFTRKVGHTQRGGRPILFDRFYAAQLGGKRSIFLSKATTMPPPLFSGVAARAFHVGN